MLGPESTVQAAWGTTQLCPHVYLNLETQDAAAAAECAAWYGLAVVARHVIYVILNYRSLSLKALHTASISQPSPSFQAVRP